MLLNLCDHYISIISFVQTRCSLPHARRFFDLQPALAACVEALDPARVGAEWIQIDEPGVAMRLDEIDLAVKLSRVRRRSV
jgi:hypothetical protein